jgi:3-dehydroquinate dehydratase-2
MKQYTFHVIHGPNLNMLGTREPDIYGVLALDDINNKIIEYAKLHNISIHCFQTNSEGEIIDYIQKNKNSDGIIINPGGYTHTSVAIRDCIAGCNIPVIEVHLSNIYAREHFRNHSYIAPVCIGQISGFGYYSYILGMEGLVYYLNNIQK